MARRLKSRASSRSTTVTVRMDTTSKTVLKQAAALRRMSVCDYVRTVTVEQARREVE